MEKSALKENAMHGTSIFPYATYKWNGGYCFPVPLHWHSETEIICLKKGVFRIMANMKEYRAEAPALLFIGSEELHSIVLPADGEESAVVFRLGMLDFEESDSIQYKIIRPLDKKQTVFPRIITSEDAAWTEAYRAYEQIYTEAEKKTLCSYLRVKAGLYELLAVLYGYGLFKDVKEIDRQDVCRIEALKNILTYIRQNMDGKITVSDAAERAGMNPQYFCRYFKRHTGKTVTEYVNDLRINEAAKELLSCEDKIIDIAGRCGYDNMGYFIKRFTQSKGMTPSEYRKKNKKVNIV